MDTEAFLRGKIAVVTGGGRGIGRAIGARLARLGADVVLAGTTAAHLERAAGDIAGFGGRARAVVADVSDEAQVRELFAAAGPVDVLINNAGIGRFGRLVDTTVEDWDRVMAVNLRGAFLCAREAMRAMAGRGGRVINIASVVGLKGYAEQGAYAASKHGLMGLSKVMGVEGREDGVITQVVAPGGVDTDLVSAARPDLDRSAMITVEDMADAVEFLLRQRGNAITDMVQIRRRGNAPW